MAKDSNLVKGVSKPQVLVVAGMVLLSTSTGFLGGWLASNSSENQRVATNSAAAKQNVINESQVISEIAETVGESVVSVSVTSEATSSNFFGFGQTFEQQSAGTGFIISEDGIVLTNRHVVAGATNLSVTLSDGTVLDDVEVLAQTGAGDPLDIAFLKINNTDGKKLKAVKLGDSGSMKVGDMVVAIGNALGQFQNTVTSGIISGYGRSIQAADEAGSDALYNLFQTDAAINQGNSGGPLVNVNGEVIGVNTAVARAENIGFAIPINDIKGLISSVLETGELKRPYLGVRYVQLNAEYAEQFGLDIQKGAFIVPDSDEGASILQDSPAEKAGLKGRDTITKVNGETVTANNSLTSLVGKHQVGEEITLTVVRDGEEIEVKATLEATENE